MEVVLNYSVIHKYQKNKTLLIQLKTFSMREKSIKADWLLRITTHELPPHDPRLGSIL